MQKREKALDIKEGGRYFTHEAGGVKLWFQRSLCPTARGYADQASSILGDSPGPDEYRAARDHMARLLGALWSHPEHELESTEPDEILYELMDFGVTPAHAGIAAIRCMNEIRGFEAGLSMLQERIDFLGHTGGRGDSPS